jgi:capsular exopolysaccharide synthesis family protein
MITSSALGEGKSTTAAYLGIAASKYAKTKTVLIDLDLRRPRLHEVFGLEKKQGVVEVLLEGYSIMACLENTNYSNLKIITSGRFNDSPSQLLGNGHLKVMFSELRAHFDLIIVDAPPVIPVSDSLLLNSEIDGALLVIKAGKTQKPVIHRGIRLLRDAKIDILGIILNNMHQVLPYYYDHGFYKYEYRQQ